MQLYIPMKFFVAKKKKHARYERRWTSFTSLFLIEFDGYIIRVKFSISISI